MTTLPVGRNVLLQLEGISVEGGWTIQQLIAKEGDATGGFFSEAYRCVNDDGRVGHFKAIDLHEALQAKDLLAALAQLADGARCEQELLEKCRTMDRVVSMLAYGTLRELRGDRLLIPIPYVIFERASGTAQKALQASARPSNEWCLQTLHHVATGLMQLHNAGIAHQDIKGSNVLQFENMVAKVSDLGRAIQKGRSVWYDASPWPGALAYQPPENAYGFQQAEFNARRFASDLYLLGSFASALFVGVPMNALLYPQLSSEFHPVCFNGPYTGTFESVSAHLQDAFDRAIGTIAAQIPDDAPFKNDLLAFIRQWCAPDPRDRGHPLTRAQQASGGNIYLLERYVSALPNMAARAGIHDRRQRSR